MNSLSTDVSGTQAVTANSLSMAMASSRGMTEAEASKENQTRCAKLLSRLKKDGYSDAEDLLSGIKVGLYKPMNLPALRIGNVNGRDVFCFSSSGVLSHIKRGPLGEKRLDPITSLPASINLIPALKPIMRGYSNSHFLANRDLAVIQFGFLLWARTQKTVELILTPNYYHLTGALDSLKRDRLQESSGSSSVGNAQRPPIAPKKRSMHASTPKPKTQLAEYKAKGQPENARTEKVVRSAKRGHNEISPQPNSEADADDFPISDRNTKLQQHVNKQPRIDWCETLTYKPASGHESIQSCSGGDGVRFEQALTKTAPHAMTHSDVVATDNIMPTVPEVSPRLPGNGAVYSYRSAQRFSELGVYVHANSDASSDVSRRPQTIPVRSYGPPSMNASQLSYGIQDGRSKDPSANAPAIPPSNQLTQQVVMSEGRLAVNSIGFSAPPSKTQMDTFDLQTRQLGGQLARGIEDMQIFQARREKANKELHEALQTRNYEQAKNWVEHMQKLDVSISEKLELMRSVMQENRAIDEKFSEQVVRKGRAYGVLRR